MTDYPDALVEAARALHEARSTIPWEATSQQDLAFRDARAAAPIIRKAAMEEAAKVIIEQAHKIGATPGRSIYSALELAQSAIRNLAKETDQPAQSATERSTTKGR